MYEDFANFKTKLDYYEMVRNIGQGTYGKVHLAIHKLTESKVAIKLVEKVKIKNFKAMQ